MVKFESKIFWNNILMEFCNEIKSIKKKLPDYEVYRIQESQLQSFLYAKLKSKGLCVELEADANIPKKCKTGKAPKIDLRTIDSNNNFTLIEIKRDVSYCTKQHGFKKGYTQYRSEVLYPDKKNENPETQEGYIKDILKLKKCQKKKQVTALIFIVLRFFGGEEKAYQGDIKKFKDFLGDKWKLYNSKPYPISKKDKLSVELNVWIKRL